MSVAKPPGQKRGHGDGQRSPLATIETVPADIPAPAHLGEVGSSVWAHVVAEAAAWLAPSDLPVLLLLCEGYERRAVLVEEINRRGAVLDEERASGPHTYTITMANPAVAMLEKLEAQLTRWLSLLGLSPSDRGRLGLQQAKKESTLDKLRARKSGSDKKAG